MWGDVVINNQTNDDYKIKIIIDGQAESPISCYLPEQVNMSSESSWSPFMDSLLPGGSQAVTTAGKTLGYQLNPLISKISAWEGNKPLEWTFDLQFNARTDAKKEVLNPIYRLLALTLPKDLGNGLVQAPGPSVSQVLEGAGQGSTATKAGAALLSPFQSLADKAINAVNDMLGLDAQANRTGTGMVQVFIGNFIHIPNVIITDVNPKFDSQFRYGIPVSAECSISFQTLYPPTLEEVKKMFVGLTSNRFGQEWLEGEDGQPNLLGDVVNFIGI